MIKVCDNDKRKRKVAATLLQHGMQTYHKKVIQI